MEAIEQLPKQLGSLASFGDKLHQWKPGQSGNPKGLKKGSKFDLGARVHRYLKKEKLLDEATGQNEPAGKLFVRTMVRKAIEGDPRWGKILAAILMPKTDFNQQVNITNNILTYQDGNRLIDEARLIAPIVSRLENLPEESTQSEPEG